MFKISDDIINFVTKDMERYKIGNRKTNPHIGLNPKSYLPGKGVLEWKGTVNTLVE